MSPEEDRTRGLSRERLVEAALALINEDGLEGLSMRALADRLDVKAASLYWHVRDRGELAELLADSILESVPPPLRGDGWRQSVVASAEALRRRVSAQRDAIRVLLECPDSLRRSAAYAELKHQLTGAGLQTGEAADVAWMIMATVIAGPSSPGTPAERTRGGAASIAVDTGSRGVVLRAGEPAMQTLVRVPRERAAAAGAVVHGEAVVVRRLRGVGLGEIELNPRRPWTFRVQAPTWNTVLDAAGLDVRAIHIDSGAAKVECFLPEPRGVVPIQVSGGVVGVTLHRPAGTAAVANVSSGAVKVQLDDFATKAAVLELRWESEGASTAADRYEIQVNSGAVKVRLDSYRPKAARPDVMPEEPPPSREAASALEILLDGVASRVRSGPAAAE